MLITLSVHLLLQLLNEWKAQVAERVVDEFNGSLEDGGVIGTAFHSNGAKGRRERRLG